MLKHIGRAEPRVPDLVQRRTKLIAIVAIHPVIPLLVREELVCEKRRRALSASGITHVIILVHLVQGRIIFVVHGRIIARAIIQRIV